MISFEAGEPDWSLLDVDDVEKLPAVKWRMQNLDGIAKNKRIALVTKLGEVLKHEVPQAQYTLFADEAGEASRQTQTLTSRATSDRSMLGFRCLHRSPQNTAAPASVCDRCVTATGPVGD